MPYLEPEGQRLLAALNPLAAFAQRSRSTLDPTDPKAVARFRHVREVEAVLNAIADYANAAEALLNPPPAPLVARVTAQLRQAHLQARFAEPLHIREVLASFTAHHLPRPDGL